ncbi:putative xanthine dehydrogenase subunit A [Peptococcaceae bacterium CEB3]|nr:putative xanthine dehydrogenase subunit A [Peptococcaceae bacterium CEB3]
MTNYLQSALWDACNGPNPFALATITWVKGSTPCKPGTQMLILPDGSTFASIGGGYAEAKVIRLAVGALAEHRSRKCVLNMSASSEEEEQLMCCGRMEVLIDVLPPDSAKAKIIKSYLEQIAIGGRPVLATVVNTPEESTLHLGAKQMFLPDGTVAGELPLPPLELLARAAAENFWLNNKAKPVRINLSGRVAARTTNINNSEWELLIEPPPRLAKLIICGGGHLALALANLAESLEFRVTVIDDRPALANRERFPKADAVICANFRSGLAALELDPDSYVVIVTRGHRYDRECFEALSSSSPAYLGMVANPDRARAFLDDLRREGFSRSLLDNFYIPAGLDLGAGTPEEIALSIMAEITQIRRGAGGLSLAAKNKEKWACPSSENESIVNLSWHGVNLS